MAPFDEEVMKFLGIVVIYQIARSEFDDLMDGFVYRAMVGLGFAIVEDVFYFMASFGGSPAGVLAGFYVRVLSSGLYGHILYAGLSGMGLAYFVTQRGYASFRRWFAVMIGLLFLAMAAHFLWDSPLLNLWPRGALTPAKLLLLSADVAVKGVPFLTILGVLLWVARRREERWFETIMISEVGLGGITAQELAVPEHPRLRRKAVRAMRKVAGPRAARLLKRLQKAQIRLAMVRTRVDRDDQSDLARQRQYCRSLREQLLAVPGAAAAIAASTRH